MKMFDVNAIPSEERNKICIARGACVELLAWFRTCFTVVDLRTGQIVDLPAIFIFETSRALLQYKHVAEINSVNAAGGCEFEQLQRQLESAVQLDHASWMMGFQNCEWDTEDFSNTEELDVAAAEISTKIQTHTTSTNEDIHVFVEVERSHLKGPSRYNKKWQNATIIPNNRALYEVRRNGNQFTTPDSDPSVWRDAGLSHLDELFFDAELHRKSTEAMDMKEQISKFED